VIPGVGLVGYIWIDFDDTMVSALLGKMPSLGKFLLLRASSSDIFKIDAFEIEGSQRNRVTLQIEVSGTETECIRASEQRSFGTIGPSLKSLTTKSQLWYTRVEAKIEQLISECDSSRRLKHNRQRQREAFLILSILQNLEPFKVDENVMNFEPLTKTAVLARLCSAANKISSFMEAKSTSV